MKEANSNPLQYSCLENPRGQRSLAGYSPRGHKELDTTERLSTPSLYKEEKGNSKSLEALIREGNDLNLHKPYYLLRFS